MIERIASIRHKDGSITIKPFFGEDFDTAEQMAREWIATVFSAADQMEIEYEEFFLLSIKHFVRSTPELVQHSRSLSQEDCEFLTECRISLEGLCIEERMKKDDQ